MSYSQKLEELQRLRAELRRLEQAAEREARAMQPAHRAGQRGRWQRYEARVNSAYQAAGRRGSASASDGAP